MRVSAGELVGAREGNSLGAQPRIPSDRDDVEYLAAAAGRLASLVRSDVIGGSRELLLAAFTAQLAAARSLQHRDWRDARSSDRRLRRHRNGGGT